MEACFELQYGQFDIQKALLRESNISLQHNIEPESMPFKKVETSKINKLVWEAVAPLREGLQSIYHCFQSYFNTSTHKSK